MNHSKLAILILIIIILSACNSKTLDEKNNDEIQENIIDQTNTNIESDDGVLTIATGEWAPYISEKLPELGFAAEIVKSAYMNENIEVEFVFYPWTRAINMAKVNAVDATFLWEINDVREEEFYYTISFSYSEDRFVFLKDNPKMPKIFAENETFDNLIVSGIVDYVHLDVMKEKNIEYEISNNEEEAFKKLLLGRIDTWPANSIVADEYFKNNYPDRLGDLVYLNPPLVHNDLRVLISRKNPKGEYYIEKFNMGLQKLRESGEYERILSKYNITFH